MMTFPLFVWAKTQTGRKESARSFRPFFGSWSSWRLDLQIRRKESARSLRPFFGCGSTWQLDLQISVSSVGKLTQHSFFIHGERHGLAKTLSSIFSRSFISVTSPSTNFLPSRLMRTL